MRFVKNLTSYWLHDSCMLNFTSKSESHLQIVYHHKMMVFFTSTFSMSLLVDFQLFHLGSGACFAHLFLSIFHWVLYILLLDHFPHQFFFRNNICSFMACQLIHFMSAWHSFLGAGAALAVLPYWDVQLTRWHTFVNVMPSSDTIQADLKISHSRSCKIRFCDLTTFHSFKISMGKIHHAILRDLSWSHPKTHQFWMSCLQRLHTWN